MSARVSLSAEAQEALELIAKHRRCSASRAAEYAILVTSRMLQESSASLDNSEDGERGLYGEEN